MTLSNEHCIMYVLTEDELAGIHVFARSYLTSVPHSECSPSTLYSRVGSHPLAPLAQELEDLWQDSSKQHLDTRRASFTGHLVI